MIPKDLKISQGGSSSERMVCHSVMVLADHAYVGSKMSKLSIESSHRMVMESRDSKGLIE